jgi:hypothetical protein
MAGGSQRQFGTMAKPLHAGLAAKNGLVAAQLETAAGRTEQARQYARTGAEWVRRTAATHVPPAFVESFLHRNAINAALLALAPP